MGSALDEHEADCSGHVVGFALDPSDHDRVGMAELWSLPVLAWNDVGAGDCRLICDRYGVLVPQVESLDDLLDIWRDRPARR